MMHTPCSANNDSILATANSYTTRPPFFILTSCNWTKEELVNFFTSTSSSACPLKYFVSYPWPVIEFGGKKGAALSTVVFTST